MKDCKFQFSRYTDVVLFFFSFFSSCAGGPWKIPSGSYFFYHERLTDLEEKIEGLWTG